MRLWFDEDLSPTLVQAAQDRGFEATCNRDRGVLGVKDVQLRETVQSEEFVLVTDNASDFRPMYARNDVHPGLIVMPGADGRKSQRQRIGEVIDWITAAASTDGQTAADFMINRLVEVDAAGLITSQNLP